MFFVGGDMANGEVCKHCGFQESSHALGDALLKTGEPCPKFVSEVEHKENCPVLGCNGNCDETIGLAARRLESKYGRIEDMD